MKRALGVSFVEVVVAAFVLAMGIIPTFYVFSRGNAGTVLNREEITARQYAGELLDYLSTRDYDQVEPTSESVPFAQIPGGEAIGPRFRRSLTVKRLVPDRGIADWPVEYKIVTAEVEWESNAQPQVFVQTSLLFKGRGR